MGLLQKACETYDCHAHLAGVIRSNQATLAPVSHTTRKVQIEITIDQAGHFVSASPVSKDLAYTIIPVTESSGGRSSSTIAPHPLSDQLQYIAPYGDKKYAKYVNQLEQWTRSEYGHPKLPPILAYIKSGTILSDLARASVIKLDSSGKPAKGSVAGTEYSKCLVRWRVIGQGNTRTSACWEDQSLFAAFQRYYQSLPASAPRDLCLISGTEDTLSENHPKGIIAADYTAKLISSDDDSGFTFRGRFANAQQACTIGYLASQKAHNALRWIVANQGVPIGSKSARTFVCWNPKGKRVPPPISPFRKDNKTVTEPTDYQKQLRETLLSYRKDLPDQEDVIVAAFDAATKGRLSITYYNELRASDFLNRIEQWYQTCCWEHETYGFQSPALDKIAACAFGVEREEKNSYFIQADDKVLKEHTQQLLHCVVDCAKIPLDIVRALTQRASMPLAYHEETRRELLYTACAVIRKYHNDIANKEVWSMQLDTQNTNRSYLFGRLLAVMEMVERSTYDSNEKREPNAIRMQSVFCERPMYAARIIQEALIPYFEKLTPGKREYYRNLIGQIMELFPESDIRNLNQKLEDTYLLGYYLQRAAIKKYKKQTDTNENTEESCDGYTDKQN